MPAKRISLESVHKYFRYEDGKLFWKEARYLKKRFLIGREAGNRCPLGYWLIMFDNKTYRRHQLVWLFHKGAFPAKGLEIDHIDGNRSNDRIENLRVVTRSQNCQNMRVHREGRSIGVHPLESGRYRAVAPFRFLDRNESFNKFLGDFSTEQEAAQAVIDYCTSS